MDSAIGPEPRNPRYRALDIWRGCACLAVLLFHVCPKPQGTESSWGTLLQGISVVFSRLWIGVPIFFVISGYCIASAVDGGRRKDIKIGAYFYRRFRRIYPPAWLLILICVAMVVFIDVWVAPYLLSEKGLFFRPWWLSGWQWLGNLTLTETWRFHFVGGPKSLYLGHYWTLCYEEQFYALMGLILFLAPRRMFSAVAVVSILAIGLDWGAEYYSVPVEGFFFYKGQWLQFAAGVLVYYWVNYATRRGAFFIAALLLMGVVFYSRDPRLLLEVDKNQEQSMVAALLTAMSLGVLHRWDAALSTSYWLEPIRLCGVMCYSLYLVHMPAILFLQGGLNYFGIADAWYAPLVLILLGVLLSLLSAVLFYRLIERRFLNLPLRGMGGIAGGTSLGGGGAREVAG